VLNPITKENDMETMTILNDGETFTDTKGCVVCEYDDQFLDANAEDLLNNGDPRDVVELVRKGNVKGRILDVAALVRFYDIMKEQFQPGMLKSLGIEKVQV
jgi:hypothetical protein